MNLEKYLVLNNGKGTLSWHEVGKKFNTSGEAARSKWRRIKSNTPSIDDIDIPFIPKKEEGMYLVLGCVHAPFTNKQFWTAMLKLAQERKNDISGLILNGDFLDMHSLSAYDKGKLAIEGINLGVEYEGGRRYLDSVLRVLHGDIYKGWLRGNHEFRFSKYMKNVDNSKLNGALNSPEEALGLRQKGFEIYLDWVNDEIELGNLSIIHGEFCNVHCTKKYIDVFKKNFLFNHTHRTSMFREGEHVAYNSGFMGDINSPIFNYATKAMKKTWSNTFSIATYYNGKTVVEQPTWLDDSFVYGGKIYQ
jgi:hypothetical protein